jgi:TetR/AcrR family transcriptional regulator, regulator of biofilm formation and stress response
VAWDDALAEVLCARTDPLTGQMLGVLLCGLIMQAVLRDDLLERADLEARLRRALR